MVNKKRLIDANDYKDVLYAKRNNPSIRSGIQSAMRMLEKQPTVDAVEVVRCKDCRWAENIESSLLRDVFVSGAKNCIIKRGDDAYGLDCSVVSPNDFCSDGERKDNGTV